MRDVGKETPERENISVLSHRGILQPLHMAMSLIAVQPRIHTQTHTNLPQDPRMVIGIGLPQRGRHLTASSE